MSEYQDIYIDQAKVSNVHKFQVLYLVANMEMAEISDYLFFFNGYCEPRTTSPPGVVVSMPDAQGSIPRWPLIFQYFIFLYRVLMLSYLILVK